MLPVLITIDTEYSSGLYRSGRVRDCDANFERTVACRSPRGEAGIFHQMAVFGRHGLKGVFFIDPMPALIWGQEAVDRVVQPILEAGHEIQLHCHTEWLDFVDGNPFGPERGHNIKDFDLETQVAILGYARDRLVEAGAPPPTAYRAGNYGASDDTLRALARIGVTKDSSFAAGYADSHCRIDLPLGQCEPVARHGVCEWPIAAISAPGGWRHGQITALSFREMRDAVRHAAATGWPAFVLVSHSFELFNRDKDRPNTMLIRRFEQLCEWLGSCDIATSAGFADLPDLPQSSTTPLMPHSAFRTATRMVEQVLANRM